MAEAVAHPAVRPRGLPLAWGLGALAFLAGSLLVALAIGPTPIGPGSIVASARASVDPCPVWN